MNSKDKPEKIRGLSTKETKASREKYRKNGTVKKSGGPGVCDILLYRVVSLTVPESSLERKRKGSETGIQRREFVI